MLLTLSAGVCLSVTTELLPTGLLPGMSRDLGVSEGTLGILVTAYAVMVALVAAPLAVVTARLPRRTLLLSTLLGYTASNLVMALCTAYSVALVARLVGGVMHGMFWGILGGFVTRIVAPDRVGRALTITAAGGVGATLLAVPAGTAAANLVGWRGSFGLLTGLGLIVAALAWRVLPNLPGRSAAARVRIGSVLRTPGLIAVLAMTLTVVLGHFAFYTYIAPFLLGAGLPEHRLGLALLGYGVMGAVGVLMAGAVVDGRLRTSIVIAIAALSGCYALLWAGQRATVVAVLLAAASGVTLGCLPIFLQTAALRLAPNAAEPVSALITVAFNIGIGGGALLGGVVVDRASVTLLPLLAAGLSGLGVLAVLADRRVGGSVAASPSRAVTAEPPPAAIQPAPAESVQLAPGS